MAISKHAKIRGQQRGISEGEMLLLLAFGRMHCRPGNAVQCVLDREGYILLEGILRKGVQILDKLKSQILICDDNRNIITCYHK